MEKETASKANTTALDTIGLTGIKAAHWNLSPAELVECAIIRGEGRLSDTGALAINTGTFTGRSPKDRFIVCDEITRDHVWWGDINIKFDSDKFDALEKRMQEYLKGKEVFVRDAQACAHEDYRMNIRAVTELAHQSLFVYNLFLRPSEEELKNFQPEWHIIAAPGFFADPQRDGTRQSNFALLNFTRKLILIGGTGYTGEIKKGIFSVLNFILPHQKRVLSMHCSANQGKAGDTAIFFGLSGTGKTTLSADPDRALIGDDEHGWAKDIVFNFEGGCYAKCVDLSKEKEPQIFDAVRFGSLLENVRFFPQTVTVDYSNTVVTENTRVSYPISYISNALTPSTGRNPKNVFFLSADAFGILPPIAKLNKGQAMFHFLSGYTAKVAGTEAGVSQPEATFSAAFGKAFLPLHPTRYAELLGEKLDESAADVWLINTGWTKGGYGTGSRMRLAYTRAMISAALSGALNQVSYIKDTVFGLNIPTSCPGVPAEVLIPRSTWSNQENYDKQANDLARLFIRNFEQYNYAASEEIRAALPRLSVKA